MPEQTAAVGIVTLWDRVATRPHEKERISPVTSTLEPLAHAKAMQFLRLIVSALAEGLAGDLGGCTIIMAKGETRQMPCHRAELLSFLYINGFAPIRSVRAHGTQRDYDEADDFLENRLKSAITAQLGSEFSEATWLELREEMADSLVNEARASAAQSQLYDALAAIISRRGETSLFGYLTRCADAAQDLADLSHDVPSLLLQIGSFSGHRTHPCAKTRLLLADGIGPEGRPLNAAEFAAYAPEAGVDVILPILAVRRNQVTASLSRAVGQDYADYFAASFPDGYRRWTAALAAMADEAAPGLYEPIPVHPLQLDAIRARFGGPIAAGDILFPTGATIIQRPTISFRTFTPLHRPAEPQVKTTLAMLMTNDVRTVSPARTFNAPVLSDLLADIASRDPALTGKFRLLRETAAIHWGRDPDRSSAEYQDGFHLGVTLRANAASVLADGEISIPLNTLVSASPAGGGRAMLLTEIMGESGVRGPVEALAWFGLYAGTVLPAIFGLLAGYGIGLEAHQQNSDIIFDASGRPRALAYRDVSDIEICEPMLLARGYDIQPALHPFIRNLYDGIDHPLRQTMHTTLVSHLFPIIDVVANAFALPTPPLFAIVKNGINAVLSDVRAALGREIMGAFDGALGVIEQKILREPIQTKRLLHKRAAPAHDVSFTLVENPLARL